MCSLSLSLLRALDRRFSQSLFPSRTRFFHHHLSMISLFPPWLVSTDFPLWTVYPKSSKPPRVNRTVIQRPIYASVFRCLTDTPVEEARVPQAGTTGRARETRVPASRCTWVALISRAAAPCTSTNLRVRFVIDESDGAPEGQEGREGDTQV